MNDDSLSTQNPPARTLYEQGASGQKAKDSSPQTNLLRKMLLPVGFVIFSLAKFLKFIPLLFKMGKFSSLLTMIVSVWAYSLFFGWPFALGFVILIFVHELGHALVLRKEGIAAGLPVFIPFVGAFISMKGMPRNAWKEAIVGIGGPILGSVGALLVLLLAKQQQSQLLFALAETGFLINLFNLLPVSPMDGGRILGGVSRYLLILGYVGGAYFYYLYGYPVLLIILILGLFQLYNTFKYPVPGYYDIPMMKKVTLGVSYGTLLLILLSLHKHTRTFTHDIADTKLSLLYSSFLIGSLIKPYLGRFFSRTR